jgi:hypothetical protein
MNKMRTFISYLILGILLVACTKQPKESTFSKLKKSHFDFTEWKKVNYQDLSFSIPVAFKHGYEQEHLLAESAYLKSIPELGIHFSVESFSAENMEDVYFDPEDSVYQEALADGLDSTTTIHHNYMLHRTESLKYYDYSLREIYTHKKKYPTLIQVVQGSANAYSEELFYVIASLKKEERYYIFQLVTNEEMCNYLYDDFLKILNSAD